MPELAEVEYHRRRWDPGLGQAIRAVEVHPAARVFRGSDVAAMVASLRGATLRASWAHGKQMLFGFSRGGWLGVHLGMTGEMRCEPAAYSAGRHDHLVLRQAGCSLVFSDPRLFGRVRFDLGAEPPEWWRLLPPPLTSGAFDAGAVAAFLRRRAGAPIKAVLLMQERFPGVGNWMADEILWRAGVHPRTRAGRLLEAGVEPLWRQIKWVTDGALAIVALDYSDPPPDWLFRHRWKDGGVCPRDGAPLRREEIGGRTTAWCPVCQPAVSRAASGRGRRSVSAAASVRRRRAGSGPKISWPPAGQGGRMTT